MPVRAKRILLLTALMLVAVPGGALVQAATQGYLAVYNVRYDQHLAAGDAETITISFDFDQWLFANDPERQTSTPIVLEDLQLNVTFPEPHSDSTIFMTDEEATFVLIDHKIALGDVPVGIYHYALDAELPPMPFYCIGLDMPAEYRSFYVTESQFCAPAQLPTRAERRVLSPSLTR